jgi:hypothetical protein
MHSWPRAISAAAGGTFGFHPYIPKMAGDRVSNMYEEIAYRGLMVSAFYGVVAAASFPLPGRADRAGLVVGTIGSCIVFDVGHEQYPIALPRGCWGGRRGVRLSVDWDALALGAVD